MIHYRHWARPSGSTAFALLFSRAIPGCIPYHTHQSKFSIPTELVSVVIGLLHYHCGSYELTFAENSIFAENSM
jgi:hypothetical protein